MRTGRRALLAAAVAASLLLCGGCMDFLKGKTKVLDANPVEALKAAYDENYPVQNAAGGGEKAVRAQIVSDTKSDLYYATIRVVNNDPDDQLTVYGYGYITSEPVGENTKKLLFFNVEKNVANSTYKAVIPKDGYCADVTFEVQNPTVKVTPDTLVFIFFSVGQKYYVGGATINDDFTYWEIEQHESGE